VAKRLALVALAGPIMGDEDPPDWPLSTDEPGTDEYLLARIAEYLKLTASGWLGYAQRPTGSLAATPSRDSGRQSRA
jgi:hypothetical protein